MQSKKNIKKLSTLCLLFIVILFVLSFNFVGAKDVVSKPSEPIGLPNPLGIVDVRVLIGRIIQSLLGLVGSLALVMFIYGGFLWMFSGGNQDRVKKGKDVLTWATLGLAIIFTSYAILKFVFTVLEGSVK